MKMVSTNRMHRGSWVALAGAVALLSFTSTPRAGATQATPPPAQGSHPTHQGVTVPTADQELLKQIAELRAQVARLQTLVEQQNPTSPKPTPAMGDKPQPGMMDNMMDKMMAMQKSEMAGMGASTASGGAASGGMSSGGMMKMDKGEMGMPPPEMKMEMGGMQMGGGVAAGSSASTMTMPQPTPNTSSLSALPGVPGGSHLYHIGSTGFFLDQPQLKLSTDQQAKLNQIKERAALARATSERQIEQAEQELWALTGAGQPDATKIQPKLQEIEQLRTAQRLGFITAVGEATSVLTPEQRDVILGIKK